MCGERLRVAGLQLADGSEELQLHVAIRRWIRPDLLSAATVRIGLSALIGSRYRKPLSPDPGSYVSRRSIGSDFSALRGVPAESDRVAVGMKRTGLRGFALEYVVASREMAV